jgi:hypothetical protein
MDEKEKQIVLKVLGSKIAKVCDEIGKASFSYSYHTVKGREYPALVISCKGKVKKIHINQAEWKALMEEKKKMKLEEIKKCLAKLPFLSEEIAIAYEEVLKELLDIATREISWKRLLEFEEIRRKYRKAYWIGENAEVLVFDVEPAKLLKVEVLKRDPVRGGLKENYWFKYLAKKGSYYLMDINKVWELTANGIKNSLGWVVKKEGNKVEVNL